ncbi:MAG: cytidine deaminase [Candidatus Aenigmarchaeota archaeon]|nr:cytidine deaminase [Candidatus Aenigmarchaeota archaeon]
MKVFTNEQLIKKAASVVRPKKTKNGIYADVGCALISGKNKIYIGTCGDSGSNVFCAEKIAIGSMITGGEYIIRKIVSVWKDENGQIFVIPPCGNCRQLIRETDEENLETQIILDKDKAVKLKELLPYFDWWKKQ